ncbi:MAG: S8 family serine peptidase [Pseudomonadota bacterium]
MKSLRYIKQFAFLGTAVFSIQAFGQSSITMYQGHEVAANQVLVKFKATATSSNIQSIMHRHDIDRDDGVGGGGVRRFHSRTKNISSLLSDLKGQAEVEYAEPDYIVRHTAAPNDPGFGQLWGLQNIGQSIQGVAGAAGTDIAAVSAWDVSVGSRSNVVAVIDSGIDYTHPDLVANVWSAPASFTVSIGGDSITCAAGTHGFNAITKTCNPMDDNGHGTHVSGTIGANGNNALGVAGVSRVASVMGVKFLGADNKGFISDAVNAIEFAVQTKALFGVNANVRVLSNSWGCRDCFSQSLLDEINRANTNDMLFVAAAVNDSSNNDALPVYPANHNVPNVISVAAINNQNQMAWFSNYGATTVHLGAPGMDVYSTLPNSSYGYMSGTSMAAPHVSGAAALILSKCSLNTAQLKTVLLANTTPVAALSGRTTTGGRLNVNSAIRSCSSAPGGLVNGGFETPSLGSGYQYSPSGAGVGWTFSGGAGIQGNGSAWGAPAAPSGSQVAFVQATGTFSESINFATAGSYTISFRAAQRACCTSPYNQQVRVLVDGVQIGLATPSSSTSYDSFAFSFSVSAAAHTITFAGTSTSGDRSAFIDAVTIVPGSSVALANNSFESPSLGSGFQYGPSGAGVGWTFGSGAGIQGNGSPWGAAAAPSGGQTAFVQNQGNLSQTATFPVTGTYTISFQAAQRSCCTSPYNQQVRVSVDGVQVGLASPSSTISYTNFSFPFSVVAGTHTITFSGTNSSGDTSAFIDAISVTR